NATRAGGAAPRAAPWVTRRSRIAAAIAALGLPITSGSRPVAAANSAMNAPQSGTGPVGVGHTRTGCVARAGRPDRRRAAASRTLAEAWVVTYYTTTVVCDAM